MRIVFTLLLAGFLLRLAQFFLSFYLEGKTLGWARAGSGSLRSALPYHSALAKKPFPAVVGYLFHIGLFLVPLWFSGHVVLWEESFLQWSWGSLPTPVADAMTLLVVVLSVLFLGRRLLLREVRQESIASDYVLIVLTALPFFSGFLLTHVDGRALFRAFHVLSGSAFLLMAVFLFVRPWLRVKACTACASCVIQCPCEALKSADQNERRILEYTPSRCILCGGCVATCPEGAAGLRHMLSFPTLARRFAGERLISAALERCRACGARFAPAPQVEKAAGKVEQDFLYFCEKCKRERVAREKLLVGSENT